jgi:hypothetical protein
MPADDMGRVRTSNMWIWCRAADTSGRQRTAAEVDANIAAAGDAVDRRHH